MEAITGTEILGQLIGNKMPINEIRALVYEGARRKYNSRGFRARTASVKAGERVKELDAEMDAQFL